MKLDFDLSCLERATFRWFLCYYSAASSSPAALGTSFHLPNWRAVWNFPLPKTPEDWFRRPRRRADRYDGHFPHSQRWRLRKRERLSSGFIVFWSCLEVPAKICWGFLLLFLVLAPVTSGVFKFEVCAFDGMHLVTKLYLHLHQSPILKIWDWCSSVV